LSPRERYFLAYLQYLYISVIEAVDIRALRPPSSLGLAIKV